MNVHLAYARLENEQDYVPQKRGRKTNKVVQNKELLKVRDIEPMTQAQEDMIAAYDSGMNIVATGSAGTGKSFIASYLALSSLFAREVQKIVVVRSAVPTRDMGHLPGSLQEKSEIYTIPYKQIFNDLCNNGTAWDILTKKLMVEFITTSYVRGITLSNAVVIVDEFQSMTSHELYSVLTRLGENSRLLICGDTKQTDLDGRKEKSCFDWFMDVAAKMPKWFDVTNFTKEDIVRSEFVRDLIMAVEK